MNFEKGHGSCLKSVSLIERFPHDLPVLVPIAIGERNGPEATGFGRCPWVVMRADRKQEPSFVVRRQLHVDLLDEHRMNM